MPDVIKDETNDALATIQPQDRIRTGPLNSNNNLHMSGRSMPNRAPTSPPRDTRLISMAHSNLNGMSLEPDQMAEVFAVTESMNIVENHGGLLARTNIAT